MGYGAFYVIRPRASSQYVTPLLVTPLNIPIENCSGLEIL